MFNEINSIFIIHQIIFFYHKLIIIFSIKILDEYYIYKTQMFFLQEMFY